MEREADLSRGMALGCFYSNLCKWACLHCARFLCEPGSQTYQSIEPRFTVLFLHLARTEVCEKDGENKKRERREREHTTGRQRVEVCADISEKAIQHIV